MSAHLDLLRVVTRRRRSSLAEWDEVLREADRLVAGWRGTRQQLHDALAWIADLLDAARTGEGEPAMPPELDPIMSRVHPVGQAVYELVRERPWLEREVAEALRVRAGEANP